MKLNGILLVSPLMSQMNIGQMGYLTTDAITVINNCEMFINTGKNVSQIKDTNTKHVIPIIRTGPGKEDFTLEFYIATNFINNEMDEKTQERYKENPNIIGPFVPDGVEVYQALDYRKQLYPRMDLMELMNELVLTNENLRDLPDNEIKKYLRRLIKEKLKNLSLKELEVYQKTFGPLSEEESENGEIINYVEDSGIVNYIIQLIEKAKAHKEIEDMSKEELKKELLLANDNEDFERSGYIRDLLEKK